MDSFFKMVDVQTVLFIYMAVGFFCRKKGIFNDAARDKLTDFVVLITLPCMIFESFHMEFSLESLKQGGVAVLIATVMAAAALLLGKVLYNRFPYGEKSILQYGTLVTNSGFAGLPVVSGAYGDEGLYLRTMDVKPFYRQLKESGRLAVCGERTEAKVVFDEDNLPLFKPGYQMRVSGEVRELSMVEVEAKAAHDRNFNVAVHDIAKYPETRVLVLHRFHGELYDYDYAMARRDHKLYRERFAFGGDTFEEPGLRITDSCIACGTCLEGCSFKAIVPGEPYTILGERCDECGNCYHACPAGAVVSKGE